MTPDLGVEAAGYVSFVAREMGGTAVRRAAKAASPPATRRRCRAMFLSEDIGLILCAIIKASLPMDWGVGDCTRSASKVSNRALGQEQRDQDGFLHDEEPARNFEFTRIIGNLLGWTWFLLR